MPRVMLALGALAMALGVALGAVSAHAVRGAAHPDAAHILQAAVLYQLVHGTAMVLEGILARTSPSRWLLAAFALHAAGIVLFCGALWLVAMIEAPVGFAAPIGGFAFIAGWLSLALHAWRMPRA